MSHGFWKQSIIVALGVSVLAACGGGGGGGGSPPPTQPPPPQNFTLGGSLTGLFSGGSVILENANGGAKLTVSADGTFAFAGAVPGGTAYDVKVATPPELQACTVVNGNGTAGANVTNITITCADVPRSTLNLKFAAIKAFRFEWTAVPGAKHYKLLEDPTGSAASPANFTQVGANIDPAVLALEHIVPLYLRVKAQYIVQACAETRCINSNTKPVVATLSQAVGHFKAESITAVDQFGFAVALSTDGTTLAVGVPAEDSEDTGVDGDPGNDVATDSGAVYVFVRDGAGAAWKQEAYIKASNTDQFDQFGTQLALSGDGSTLAVAAPGEDGDGSSEADDNRQDAGAVYVFERSNGAWERTAYVKAENGTAFDKFGHSVALSRDGLTLAVGTIFEDGSATTINGTVDNLKRDAGAVFVFRKQGTAWVRDAYVKAPNSEIEDHFGVSVALSEDGTTLAVGADLEDGPSNEINGPSGNGADAAGAVYVFTRVGPTWTHEAYIKPKNTGEPRVGEIFGSAVDLSDDGSTLAVGAHQENGSATGIDGEIDEEADDAGAAYVFVRTGTQWEQQASIKASNTGEFDKFGSSLALSADGSTLAVGATGEDSGANGVDGDKDSNSQDRSGAAYVFERSNGVWAQRAYVKPSNTLAGFAFGIAVALSGDGATLAVGAHGENGSVPGINQPQTPPTTTVVDAGAVYLY